MKTIDEIIRNHVLYSMGAGLIPVPLLDIAAVTAVQVDMIHQIAESYGQDFSATRAKAWIGALSGSFLARLGADAVKLIPGVGPILGGVSMAVISGAGTYAIGQIINRHYAGGGTSATFNAESFKQAYKEEFEKGKTKAQEWQKKGEKPTETDARSAAFVKIKELAELKESGAISEEEFAELKKKIIAEF
jgi:uncharacterized protein (DUF697 family)